MQRTKVYSWGVERKTGPAQPGKGKGTGYILAQGKGKWKEVEGLSSSTETASVPGGR